MTVNGKIPTKAMRQEVACWLDPGVKLTVLYREADGFDPQCNVYRPDVERVRGDAGRVDRVVVPA